MFLGMVITLVISLIITGVSIAARRMIERDKATHSNLRLITIYQRTVDWIVAQAAENDSPIDETITALNAAVDAYNEGLIGKNCEQYRVKHFPPQTPKV